MSLKEGGIVNVHSHWVLDNTRTARKPGELYDAVYEYNGIEVAYMPSRMQKDGSFKPVEPVIVHMSANNTRIDGRVLYQWLHKHYEEIQKALLKEIKRAHHDHVVI